MHLEWTQWMVHVGAEESSTHLEFVVFGTNFLGVTVKKQRKPRRECREREVLGYLN